MPDFMNETAVAETLRRLADAIDLEDAEQVVHWLTKLDGLLIDLRREVAKAHGIN